MKRLFLFFALFLAVDYASAQSLKPDNPYPLKSGINQATSDSLVGTQYWYFYATPGSNRLTVRFKNPTTLYGAGMGTTVITITVADANRSWRIVKTVTSNKNQAETSFTADKVAKKMKITVAVAPPNQNLVRMGGDYEIEATGDVAFGEVSSTDPIIRTYDSKVNTYGATRFLADGAVIASDGSRGTWKVFDAENHIYSIQIDTFRWSVQYLPGYGLVKPSEPNIIVFQELRR
jgi:hypothetical protein